jgi:predicted metalloprotease
MRWDESQSSDNVEDRRGLSGGVMAGGGILSVIVALVGVFVFGLDPRQAQQLGNVAGQGANAVRNRIGGAGGEPGTKRPPDEIAKFTRAVVFMTEEVWTDQFRKMGKRYEKPKVVLFSDSVNTGCGTAPSAVGPFYCPADRIVYLDPTFFNELDQKLGGSKAAFSQAYVIAHEVGHHIQNQLGYSDRVKQGDNDASVRLELQADYLAGCWAYYADQKYHILEPGDLESAVKSANAIGDDRLQKRSKGWTSPESYTHGTSEQRVRNFTAGYKTGDLSKLDRFFEVRRSSDL